MCLSAAVANSGVNKLTRSIPAISLTYLQQTKFQLVDGAKHSHYCWYYAMDHTILSKIISNIPLYLGNGRMVVLLKLCLNWSLVCRRCASDNGCKVYQYFYVIDGVRKQCQTWHLFVLTVINRCHVWHRRHVWRQKFDEINTHHHLLNFEKLGLNRNHSGIVVLTSFFHTSVISTSEQQWSFLFEIGFMFVIVGSSHL